MRKARQVLERGDVQREDLHRSIPKRVFSMCRNGMGRGCFTAQYVKLPETETDA